MLTHRETLALAVIGAGLGVAASADAGVTLVSQSRTISVLGSSSKTDSTSGTGDWNSNRLFSQSGANGYWNGAYQYSSFQPDGTITLGEAMLVQATAKSVRFGTFAPGSTWSASTLFQSTFSVGAISQIMDLTMSVQLGGSGSSVTATLTRTGGPTVWSFSSTGDDLQSLTLTTGTYQLSILASSTLTSSGVGGSSQFNFGANFANIPAPPALAMVAATAFLRRRRT